MVRRDLATTAAPFARSIDGHLAHHDLQTGRAAPAASREGITKLLCQVIMKFLDVVCWPGRGGGPVKAL
jgi:hypothetical protein